MLFFCSCKPDPYTGKVIGKVHHDEWIATGEMSEPEEYLIYMDNGWIYQVGRISYITLDVGDSIEIG